MARRSRAIIVTSLYSSHLRLFPPETAKGRLSKVQSNAGEALSYHVSPSHNRREYSTSEATAPTAFSFKHPFFARPAHLPSPRDCIRLAGATDRSSKAGCSLTPGLKRQEERMGGLCGAGWTAPGGSRVRACAREREGGERRASCGARGRAQPGHGPHKTPLPPCFLVPKGRTSTLISQGGRKAIHTPPLKNGQPTKRIQSPSSRYNLKSLSEAHIIRRRESASWCGSGAGLRLATWPYHLPFFLKVYNHGPRPGVCALVFRRHRGRWSLERGAGIP